MTSSTVALPRRPLLEQVAASLIKSFIAGAARGLSGSGWLGARALGHLGGIERRCDVPYAVEHPRQTLDVWRAAHAPHGDRPLLLYFHGGGFQLCSKDTHWPLALWFARAGFVVMTSNYGLCPEHPFPRAPHDALRAFRFAVEQAAALGADPRRIVVAGESAGANLALGLAIAATTPLPDPEAREVLALACPPRAVLSYSGLLQVSQMGRFFEGGKGSALVRARMADIARDYIGCSIEAPPRSPVDALLDPGLFLERHHDAIAKLPPVLASVGLRDPICADTLRLGACLASDGRHRIDVYPGENHAFEALVVRRASRYAHAASLAFLEELESNSARAVHRSAG